MACFARLLIFTLSFKLGYVIHNYCGQLRIRHAVFLLVLMAVITAGKSVTFNCTSAAYTQAACLLLPMK